MDAMAEVKELMEKVKDGMKDVRPEVAEECARQIRASEGELALGSVEPCQHQQSPPQEHLLHLSIRQVEYFGYRDKQSLNICIEHISSQPKFPDPYPRFRWLQRCMALP
jgi:hypothetical protein